MREGAGGELESLRQQVRKLDRVVEALSSKIRRLERRESQLRQILDLVPELIFAVDWDGRFILANKALAAAYGCGSTRDLCGRLAEEVAPDAEQWRAMLADHRAVMDGGEPSVTAEQTVVDAAGRRHVVHIHRIPYMEAVTGKPAVMGVVIDITDLKDNQRNILRARDAVIFGMARLAESRDDETGRHLERICRYVEILAAGIAAANGDLDEDWVHTVSTTAALHDIGKVGIPDRVLLKPGPLDQQEREVIQRHTYIGGDTLLDLKRHWGDDPFLVTAAQIAMSHHEKWNGRGYPFGLAGDDIPLSARIVAVADVYDALTSKRCYKEPMSHDDARRIIAEGAGEHFDPAVVRVFLDAADDFRRAAGQAV